MVSEDADRSSLEALARRFHERELEDDPEDIGELLHEQVEATLIVSRLRPLHGRSTVVQALARGRETMIYSAQVDRVDWLGDNTVLLSANARYALDGGLAAGRIWWLDEFKDGLLFRIRAFHSEAEARAGHPPAVSVVERH